MSGFQQQLAYLRAKVAGIDRKYEVAAVRNLLPGEEIQNSAGCHWEISHSWPGHHRHGSADVGALSELPPDHFPGADCPPARWVFLDTETTGIAGGTGTVAFLVGIGWISHRGFELRQFFMRDHSEEASLLTALAGVLDQFEWMVTYNGRAYDQPLLEARYRLSRIPSPFERLRHMDLLYNARRLWKLRLESCRLQDLEDKILNVQRQGDVEGAFIPELYFRYLHSRDASALRPVFTHNATDILSLACLSAIVPVAFKEPKSVTQSAEMVGLARWLRREGRVDEALDLMRRALRHRLPDDLVYQTLWHIAEMEKKAGRHEGAVSAWSELVSIVNPWRGRAFEQLAIYYERRERNYGMALEMTRMALEHGRNEGLERREARLAARSAGPRSGRLL